jgi:hypothetical protein
MTLSRKKSFSYFKSFLNTTLIRFKLWGSALHVRVWGKKQQDRSIEQSIGMMAIFFYAILKLIMYESTICLFLLQYLLVLNGT